MNPDEAIIDYVIQSDDIPKCLKLIIYAYIGKKEYKYSLWNKQKMKLDIWLILKFASRLKLLKRLIVKKASSGNISKFKRILSSLIDNNLMGFYYKTCSLCCKKFRTNKKYVKSEELECIDCEYNSILYSEREIISKYSECSCEIYRYDSQGYKISSEFHSLSHSDIEDVIKNLKSFLIKYKI
jgi:hypothetical protein